MQIKSVEFAEEIRDINCDTVDVYVEAENGYVYTVPVGTPRDLVEEMDELKTDFIEARSPTIFVRKLTKEIVTQAILSYAEDRAYWLKLQQFADDIDISILNKMEAKHLEEWELFELKEVDRFFYYIQKYTKISSEYRVLMEPMIFLTLFSSVGYCALKPGLLDFFSNFTH